MREFATCDGICREQKLELVSGGDYEELATAGAQARCRIQELLPLVAELAGPVSPGPDSPARYEALRERARLVVHDTGLPVREDGAATVSAATVVVWRCPDCGGLEETQPCIGVCIWRPADWVSLDAFESTRAQALQDIESERVLLGLVTRFAWVRPRDGEWEQNWRAFHAQARLALEGQVLTA
jgi:hypothetical protein